MRSSSALSTFLSLFLSFSLLLLPSFVITSPLSLFNSLSPKVHLRDRPHISDSGFASFSETCDAHSFHPATCVFSAHCVKKADGISSNDTYDIIASGEDKGRRNTGLDLNKCIGYYVKQGEENDPNAQTEMDSRGVKLPGKVEVQRPYGSMCKDFPCKAEDLNNAVNLFPLVTCDRGWDKPRLVLDYGISNNDGYLECFGQRGV